MKRTVTILLALLMLLSLAACGAKTDDAQASTPPAAEEGEAFAGADVNIAVLAGPTGIGASALMEKNDAGETVNRYTFSVESAPDQVTAGIVNGSLDMAAVPTNVASILYTKTEGNVQVCALTHRALAHRRRFAPARRLAQQAAHQPPGLGVIALPAARVVGAVRAQRRAHALEHGGLVGRGFLV